MRTKKEIEKLTGETLNSIENMQPIQANVFLFGKIQNRMQLETREQLARIKTMARLSAALVLFIGLNVGSFYFLSGENPKTVVKAQPTKKSTAAEAIAAEYHLNGNAYNY